MKKSFIIITILLLVLLFCCLNACRKNQSDVIRPNDIERPDLDMTITANTGDNTDIERPDLDMTITANTGDNKVYAQLMDYYTMSFNGVVIAMDHNLTFKRFDGKVQNLSSEPITIVTLYARFYNGHQSSSVHNIVLQPNEIYHLIQVLDYEYSFDMWQPYIEIEFNGEDKIIKSPSVSITEN